MAERRELFGTRNCTKPCIAKARRLAGREGNAFPKWRTGPPPGVLSCPSVSAEEGHADKEAPETHCEHSTPAPDPCQASSSTEESRLSVGSLVFCAGTTSRQLGHLEP